MKAVRLWWKHIPARVAPWRFRLLMLVTLPLLLRALLSFAAPSKDPRVVMLVERGASLYLQASKGFKQQFAPSPQAEVFYVDSDRDLNATVETLRKDPPQLVVAFGTQAAIAAKSRIRAPLLYCLALNPVKNDLVGPNVGGIRLETDLSEQLAVLEKLLPRVRTIGVIYSEPVSGTIVRQARASLRPDVRLIFYDARDARQAAHYVEEIMGQVDGFWLLLDPVIANVSNFRLLVDLSLKNKVALIAPAPPFVEAGALVSVAADYEKAGERAGEMARSVLAGARAGDFGAESPSARVITINASVARQLGIAIPPGLKAEVLSPGFPPARAPGEPKR